MIDSRASRAPLSDATGRINNAASLIHGVNKLKENPQMIYNQASADGFTSKQKNPIRKQQQQQQHHHHHQPQRHAPRPPPQTTVSAASIAISNNIILRNQHGTASASVSHNPAVPSRSKEGYKTLVGPWTLGKTLGRGSNGQVRLCRHRQTGQDAAVKIISKKAAARFSQETSMAALNRIDSPQNDANDRRVPVAIEREVAILKLVDHPNILKLYDMWENRSDM